MQKWVWLGAGVVLGSMLSVYWPTEPAYAGSADSNQKLSICTTETQVGQSEAVFVLDHVTGRLTGAGYNSQTQGFNQAFFRSIAQDFGLTEAGVYVMTPGLLLVQGRSPGDPPANGGVYIAELTSGKVALYGFPYSNRKGVTPPREMVPMATYDFREAQK
jgi:hypothetical protein